MASSTVLASRTTDELAKEYSGGWAHLQRHGSTTTTNANTTLSKEQMKVVQVGRGADVYPCVGVPGLKYG